MHGSRASSRPASIRGQSAPVGYRAVTPMVSAEDRSGLADWKRAYDCRFLASAKALRETNVNEIYDATYRVHADKMAYYTQRDLPNLTQMDLSVLSRERSLQQRQPGWHGDVGGPPRVGVLSKRMATPLGARTHLPALNLGSKQGRFFGT